MPDGNVPWCGKLSNRRAPSALDASGRLQARPGCGQLVPLLLPADGCIPHGSIREHWDGHWVQAHA